MKSVIVVAGGRPSTSLIGCWYIEIKPNNTKLAEINLRFHLFPPTS